MENNREQELSVNTKANPKVTVDWAKNFGGEFFDEGFGVDVDKEGNIYLTGSFQDKVTFGDIELESNGSSDAYVVKLDNTGRVLWAEKLGGNSVDEAYGIKVDEAGNSFVTGSFRNTVTFGTPDASGENDLEAVAVERIFDESTSETPQDIPLILNLEEIPNPPKNSFSLTAEGTSDGFITKLDASGKVQWAKQFSGDNSEFGEKITINSEGNTFVIGNFKTEATFDDFTLNGNGSNDGFVSKFDADGKATWATKFGGDSFDRGKGIAVDEAGNTYITGIFESSAKFGNLSLNTQNSRDIFVAKLDEAGDFEWAKNFGGTAADKGNAIAVDNNGNTYITGTFRNTITFGDTTLKSNGLNDGFITKLDAEGDVVWAKKFGDKSNEEGFGIALDESENIYLTGSFEDRVIFGDTTLTSPAIDNKDAFIAKLDKMGMVKWAKQLGSNDFDEGYEIAVKGDSETYVTGSFLDSAIIDQTTINHADKSDAFLVKLAEEMPEISLAVTPTTISEDGDDKLTYTFTRSGGNTDPLTVNFMVAGDAVFNQDYTQTGADSFSASEGMITFDDGETTAAITIDATDDTVIEEDETIKLTVTAAKYDKEEEEEDKETPTDDGDRAILREASAEATKEDEIAPEEVGKLMQSTVRDYKISTASEVMATITNDDTQSNGGSNSGEGENSGGGVNTSVATQISNSNKTFTLDGDSAKIKFLLKKSKAGSVNEIALFEVDDEQGMVNGVSPDDSNYAEVASQNATRVFSALGNPPKGLSTDLNRIIELDNGKSFRLLMVKNGTLDGLRNGTVDLSQVLLSDSLEVTDAGENNFDLGFSTDAGDNEDIMVQMQLDNQAMKPIGTNLQDEPEGELLDLRGVTGTQTATFTVYREAAYDNYVGWYKVANQNGGIDTDGDGVADVLTTDTGYAAAALNNRVADIDLRVANQGAVEITGEFEGGSIFAPFLIADGTPDDLLDNNAINDPEIYFTYISANSDNKDHARMLGDNIFGFEDLPEGGDGDFNDIVVGAKFA